jgi:hypothetical protein
MRLLRMPTTMMQFQRAKRPMDGPVRFGKHYGGVVASACPTATAVEVSIEKYYSGQRTAPRIIPLDQGAVEANIEIMRIPSLG